MIEVARDKQAWAHARGWRPSAWLAWGVCSIFIGGVLAVSVQTVLYGRTPFLVAARGWFTTPLPSMVFLAAFAWWMAYGRVAAAAGLGVMRAQVLPAIPLMAFTAVPLVAIHLSDTANHYFYYGMVELNQPKGLAVLLLVVAGTVVLQAVAVGRRGEEGTESSVLGRAKKVREPLVLALLLAMGSFQAAAYMPPPGLDFSRYWLVADAMGPGLPYAANTGTDSANLAIGMTGFIIDLPLYPAMMAVSFALFGHTVAAAYLPIALFNAVLPLSSYLLYKEFFPNRIAAVSLASLVTLFPLLRFYTLNFPVPDSIFLTFLVSGCWLLVRLVRKQRSVLEWIAFGALAAGTALVRTEGIAYASLYMLVALLSKASWRQRAAGLVAYLAPLAVFSVTLWGAFGMPWPRTFAGALGPWNLWGNLRVLVTDEFFTAAIRIPSEGLALGWGLLLLLAALGTLPFFHRPRRLAVLIVPAWVNLLMVMLADPRVSGARLWFDFFRHVSYVLPLFVLGGATVVAFLVQRIRAGGLRAATLVAVNVLLFLGVVWDLHSLSLPSWSFGPDAVNLVSQDRPNMVDFVAHPYELPIIEYETSGTHSEPVMRSDFFNRYPDPLIEFYKPFDAIKLLTGAAYETASALIYLAALFVAALPGLLSMLSRSKRLDMHGTGLTLETTIE